MELTLHLKIRVLTGAAVKTSHIVHIQRLGYNKVIGTRRQGVRVWCLRELTTKHLTEPSLWLDQSLGGRFGLRP